MLDEIRRFLKRFFASGQAKPSVPMRGAGQGSAPDLSMLSKMTTSAVETPPSQNTTVQWNWRDGLSQPVQTEAGEMADLVRRLAALGWVPQELQVFGSLSLNRTRIRALPSRLTVNGDLELGQCHRLRSLGDELRVNGNLRIGGTLKNPPENLPEGLPFCIDRRVPITSLPRQLDVGGDLELRDCTELKTFLGEIRVGKSILLRGCNLLQSLPANWHVHGSLEICGCRSLTGLPAGLRVDGDLCLKSTMIQSLPDDLQLGGSLQLTDCAKLHELPPNLVISGDLRIHHGNLRELPHGLKVGRNLQIHRAAKFSLLPPDLEVSGNLVLLECLALERFPAGIRLGGNLCLYGCKALRELPQDLHVRQSLDLSGCSSLTTLPTGLRIEKSGARSRSVRQSRMLRLVGCSSLTSLPADLKVETVELAHSGIKELPANLEERLQVMWRGVQVPAEVVFHPERLDPVRILREPNAELRRVMVERVGTDEILRRVNARVIDRDTDPGGERQLIELPPLARGGTSQAARVSRGFPQQSSSFYRFLVCRCPSTARQYILRVPPTTATCRQAAAWLAGFNDPDAYHPIHET